MRKFCQPKSFFRRIICQYILKPIDKHDICIVMLLTLITSELGELIDPKKDIQKPFSLAVLFTIITSTFYHFFSELSTIDKVLSTQQQSIYDVQKNVCSIISRSLCIATYIIILCRSSVSTFYVCVYIVLVGTNSLLLIYSIYKLCKRKKFDNQTISTRKSSILTKFVGHIKSYGQRSIKYFIKIIIPVCMTFQVIIDFSIDRVGENPPYSWMKAHVPLLYFGALSTDPISSFLEALSDRATCNTIYSSSCGQNCASILKRIVAFLDFLIIVIYFIVLGITVDMTRDFSKPDSKTTFFLSLIGLILSSLAVISILCFVRHKSGMGFAQLAGNTMHYLFQGNQPTNQETVGTE